MASPLAASRTLRVPPVLVPYLRELAEGKAGHDLLFGHHWRDWPRHWVKRICAAAGVPKVTAHGMRGAHASLATEQGVTPQVVAAALGHESAKTTLRSYATAASVAAGQQRRLIDVLDLSSADNESPGTVVPALSDGQKEEDGGRQPPETT